MAQTAVLKSLPVTSNVEVERNRKRGDLFAKSSRVAFGDTTTVSLFRLPGNVLITDVLVRVLTAFDASGTSAAATATISIPNDTGTEVLWDAANLALQSTGFKSSTSKGITPSSGGLLTLSYTPGTTSAGELEVYVNYVCFANAL